MTRPDEQAEVDLFDDHLGPASSRSNHRPPASSGARSGRSGSGLSDPSDRGSYQGVLGDIPDPPERPPMLIPSRPLLGVLGDPASARAAAGSVASGAGVEQAVDGSFPDSGSEPLPTGQIPMVEAVGPVPFDPTSPVRAALQTAVVGLAALLVGLVVFATVRSAVTDDAELADPDPDADVPTIDPGPGDPGASDDRLGNERGTAELDGRTGDGAPVDPTGGTSDSTGSDDLTQSSGTTGVDASPRGDSRASSAGNPPPAGPATSRTTLGPGTGGGLAPSGPTGPAGTTNPGGSTGAPTAPRSSSSTTTTASTTATTASTTTASTTTTTASTTPPPPSLPLIAAPGGGVVVTWESTLTFQANPVAGATTYCWALDGLGGRADRCSSSPTYRLPGASRTPGPGPVTVEAEARDGGGSVLRSQRITITLLARDVIASPTQGDSLNLSRPIRLNSRNVPGATRYCWILAQGSVQSDSICTTGRAATVRAGSANLDGFGVGPVTVRVVAERDGIQIGSDAVVAELVDPRGGSPGGGEGGGGDDGGSDGDGAGSGGSDGGGGSSGSSGDSGDSGSGGDSGSDSGSGSGSEDGGRGSGSGSKGNGRNMDR